MEFVRQHLEQLPVTVENGGRLDIILERQDYLLYDNMVAYHIQQEQRTMELRILSRAKAALSERLYDFLPDQVNRMSKRMELVLMTDIFTHH